MTRRAICSLLFALLTLLGCSSGDSTSEQPKAVSKEDAAAAMEKVLNAIEKSEAKRLAGERDFEELPTQGFQEWVDVSSKKPGTIRVHFTRIKNLSVDQCPEAFQEAFEQYRSGMDAANKSVQDWMSEQEWMAEKDKKEAAIRLNEQLKQSLDAEIAMLSIAEEYGVQPPERSQNRARLFLLYQAFSKLFALQKEYKRAVQESMEQGSSPEALLELLGDYRNEAAQLRTEAKLGFWGNDYIKALTEYRRYADETWSLYETLRRFPGATADVEQLKKAVNNYTGFMIVGSNLLEAEEALIIEAKMDGLPVIESEIDLREARFVLEFLMRMRVTRFEQREYFEKVKRLGKKIVLEGYFRREESGLKFPNKEKLPESMQTLLEKHLLTVSTLHEIYAADTSIYESDRKAEGLMAEYLESIPELYSAAMLCDLPPLLKHPISMGIVVTPDLEPQWGSLLQKITEERY
ncbi:Hypothetical protein PBC10988_24620 [Planctomycetales bacterium 10988]|nr:Hypothetical protein PBC10988_24620 [Planctomycetales bacterium 10988]